MRRKSVALIAVASAVVLVGCGSGEGGADSDSGGDQAATEMLEVPDGGPESITEFPAPEGSEITEIGAGLGNWAFVVVTDDPESVIEFYANELPNYDFDVTEDVTVTAFPDQTADLGLSGPASGIVMINDPLGGVNIMLDENEDLWE